MQHTYIPWVAPLPRIPDTTRMIIFLVRDPYKPSFATVTGRGDNPTGTLIYIPCKVKANSSWWLNQPIWKICSSNWKSSPNRDEIFPKFRDEHKKYLKPPPNNSSQLIPNRPSGNSWSSPELLLQPAPPSKPRKKHFFCNGRVRLRKKTVTKNFRYLKWRNWTL